jgi:hypothetical protein
VEPTKTYEGLEVFLIHIDEAEDKIGIFSGRLEKTPCATLKRGESFKFFFGDWDIAAATGRRRTRGSVAT